MSSKKPHGAKPPRGLETTPRSEAFEGVFGRMFRTLPPARFGLDDLASLAKEMVADMDPPTPEEQVDDEENQGISAGYTYFGQFIDHDLTFDPSSSLMKTNDPNGLIDYRTPRFDLDNLYGRGPDDQPYLYQDDGLHMLLGRKLSGNDSDPNTRDLPRNTANPARALVGDARNDENVIVSQLQGIMLRFHNSMADLLASEHGRTPDFQEVQQAVRWHYQWVILHDFLPTIVGEETMKSVLPHLFGPSNILQRPAQLKFYHFEKDPFIPVEFSVGVYRFGHSMVRPIYRLNERLRNRFDIFGTAHTDSLAGFREFPEDWAIDWNLFFNPGDRPNVGRNRTQPAYKIDSSLVNPLGKLPPSVVSQNPDIPSLAHRNLLRGLSMQLPSGQAVARFMGINVINDADLRVGKATKADTSKNKPLTKLSQKFAGNAPLWYYILAEAQQQFVADSTAIRLGPVGGRIVAEVFVGLMLGDSHSFLNMSPSWKPEEKLQQNGQFRIKDLIRQAQKA